MKYASIGRFRHFFLLDNQASFLPPFAAYRGHSKRLMSRKRSGVIFRLEKLKDFLKRDFQHYHSHVRGVKSEKRVFSLNRKHQVLIVFPSLIKEKKTKKSNVVKPTRRERVIHFLVARYCHN